MREQIDNEMLEEITGGKIHYSWKKDTQSGSVSSNITGETLTFGADKANAIYKYVLSHRNEPDDVQMNGIRNIINS